MVSLCWTCCIHKASGHNKNNFVHHFSHRLTTCVYAQLSENVKLLPAGSLIHAEVKTDTGFQLRLCIQLAQSVCNIKAVPSHCAIVCVCAADMTQRHGNNDVSVANMQNQVPIHTAIACDVVRPNVSTIDYPKREGADLEPASNNNKCKLNQLPLLCSHYLCATSKLWQCNVPQCVCVSAVDVFHTNVKTMPFHDTRISGKM